jgi:hypothetical protein
VAAVALALIAVAAGAAVVLTKKKPAPAIPPPVAAQLPVHKPAPPPAPPKVVEFTMAIDTVPAGAEVMNGAEVLGVTPFDLVLPSSATPVELTLKKKGFRDQTLKVTPDKNHHYLADLLPASRTKPAAAKPAAAKPASRPSRAGEPGAVAAPPKPSAAEPAAPKAAGKLRDLKDPFGN